MHPPWNSIKLQSRYMPSKVLRKAFWWPLKGPEIAVCGSMKPYLARTNQAIETCQKPDLEGMACLEILTMDVMDP